MIDQTLVYAIVIGVLSLGIILTLAQILGVRRESRPLAAIGLVVSVALIVILDGLPGFLARWGLPITIALGVVYAGLALVLNDRRRRDRHDGQDQRQ